MLRLAGALCSMRGAGMEPEASHLVHSPHLSDTLIGSSRAHFCSPLHLECSLVIPIVLCIWNDLWPQSSHGFGLCLGHSGLKHNSNSCCSLFQTCYITLNFAFWGCSPSSETPRSLPASLSHSADGTTAGHSRDMGPACFLHSFPASPSPTFTRWFPGGHLCCTKTHKP